MAHFSLGFLDLPPEIRNWVYDSLLPNARNYTYSTSPSSSLTVAPGILTVSSLVRSETLPIWYARNVFRLNIGKREDLLPVRGRFDLFGFKHMRCLRISKHLQCSRVNCLPNGSESAGHVAMLSVELNIVSGTYQHSVSREQPKRHFDKMVQRVLQEMEGIVAGLARKGVKAVAIEPDSWVDAQTTVTLRPHQANHDSGWSMITHAGVDDHRGPPSPRRSWFGSDFLSESDSEDETKKAQLNSTDEDDMLLF